MWQEGSYLVTNMAFDSTCMILLVNLSVFIPSLFHPRTTMAIFYSSCKPTVHLQSLEVRAHLSNSAFHTWVSPASWGFFQDPLRLDILALFSAFCSSVSQIPPRLSKFNSSYTFFTKLWQLWPICCSLPIAFIIFDIYCSTYILGTMHNLLDVSCISLHPQR